jgi:hypothetical protein
MPPQKRRLANQRLASRSPPPSEMLATLDETQMRRNVLLRPAKPHTWKQEDDATLTNDNLHFTVYPND